MPLGISLKIIILFPIQYENIFILHKYGGHRGSWGIGSCRLEAVKPCFRTAQLEDPEEGKRSGE